MLKLREVFVWIAVTLFVLAALSAHGVDVRASWPVLLCVGFAFTVAANSEKVV